MIRIPPKKTRKLPPNVHRLPAKWIGEHFAEIYAPIIPHASGELILRFMEIAEEALGDRMADAPPAHKAEALTICREAFRDTWERLTAGAEA
ncbi:hypothetical protein MALG_01735 [Marinovum algicola DG 898]|nr:hypothetical protein MALG_01735 [Marinovum algicola DG 898]